MGVDKLTSEVYYGVRAVLIGRIQAALNRSGKYVTDIITKLDTNKDKCLEYSEFEAMLLELQVPVNRNMFDKILIDEIFDEKR